MTIDEAAHGEVFREPVPSVVMSSTVNYLLSASSYCVTMWHWQKKYNSSSHVHIKWCRGPEAIPLAGDWDAAEHIHSDRWQSNIHLDQSEGTHEDNHVMAEHVQNSDWLLAVQESLRWSPKITCITNCNYLMTGTCFNMRKSSFDHYISNEVTSFISVIAPEGNSVQAFHIWEKSWGLHWQINLSTHTWSHMAINSPWTVVWASWCHPEKHQSPWLQELTDSGAEIKNERDAVKHPVCVTGPSTADYTSSFVQTFLITAPRRFCHLWSSFYWRQEVFLW